MNPAELLWLPLRELGRRLRQGEVSPVALAEAALERLRRLGPGLNCVVTLTPERALRQARQAEAELRQGHVRGPLHGIPYGAKDLFATGEGIPTTWGMAALKEQRLEHNAAAIEALERAGAPLAAKLAMVELAGGMKYDQPDATFTGPGINPWQRGAWSGGSSSGSASAVAAGLLPFALGTETWGSITSPCAFCGLTGLRPTLGRVSRRGAMALSWTLDKIGPLAHGADDCGLVLEALAGPDPGPSGGSAGGADSGGADAGCLNEQWRYVPSGGTLPSRRLRLARLPAAEESPQPAVAENFARALQVLEPIADIASSALPAFPYTEATSLIMFSEASSAFDAWLAGGAVGQKDRGAETWRQLTAVETHTVPLATRTIPARDYINALRLRQRIQREVLAWLRDFDAVVTPTLKVVAPPLEQRFSDYFGAFRRQDLTTLGNLIGLPALTVPTGFGERGLPTALQFVGAPGTENLLLALGNWYQERTDWHRRRPPE